MSNELPGATILFKTSTCTGYNQNSFGNGSMDISLHRPDYKFNWVDIGHIYFSRPTPEQVLDAETSPSGSDGQKAYGDMNRRLSFKQANYINLLIQDMLMKEFNGIIPPDDEIEILIKQRFGR